MVFIEQPIYFNRCVERKQVLVFYSPNSLIVSKSHLNIVFLLEKSDFRRLFEIDMKSISIRKLPIKLPFYVIGIYRLSLHCKFKKSLIHRDPIPVLNCLIEGQSCDLGKLIPLHLSFHVSRIRINENFGR